MNIRRLTGSDRLEGAIELLQRFFREEGFATPNATIAAHVKRMAEIETCAIMAAEEAGQTAAVATLSFEFGIEYGWSAEMGDLYVAKPWRGRGLARRMVQFAEGLILQRGASGYQVTVTALAEDHHGLTGFYRKLGFHDEGRRILFKPIRSPDYR